MKTYIEAELPTDSQNYEVITEGVRRVAGIPGMTCEIGLRRGGGSKYIIDALLDTSQRKVHIAIDPYGNIEYADTDDHITRFDYTNDMRDECLANMHFYCRQRGQSFIFFNLEDTEFFARFADGVPVYNKTKTIETQYSFVHFDGPHAVVPLLHEVAFFHERTPQGAVFVFDDVGQYDHARVHTYLTSIGWEAFRTTPRKWAYYKK